MEESRSIRFKCLCERKEAGVIRVCGEVSKVIRKADKQKYWGQQCARCKSEGITGKKTPPAEGKQKNNAWEQVIS